MFSKRTSRLHPVGISLRAQAQADRRASYRTVQAASPVDGPVFIRLAHMPQADGFPPGISPVLEIPRMTCSGDRPDLLADPGECFPVQISLNPLDPPEKQNQPFRCRTWLGWRRPSRPVPPGGVREDLEPGIHPTGPTRAIWRRSLAWLRPNSRSEIQRCSNSARPACKLYPQLKVLISETSDSRLGK